MKEFLISQAEKEFRKANRKFAITLLSMMIGESYILLSANTGTFDPYKNIENITKIRENMAQNVHKSEMRERFYNELFGQKRPTSYGARELNGLVDTNSNGRISMRELGDFFDRAGIDTELSAVIDESVREGVRIIGSDLYHIKIEYNIPMSNTELEKARDSYKARR